MAQTHNVVGRVVDVVDPGVCLHIIVCSSTGGFEKPWNVLLGIFEAAEYFKGICRSEVALLSEFGGDFLRDCLWLVPKGQEGRQVNGT